METINTLWLLRNHVLPSIVSPLLLSNFEKACPLFGTMIDLTLARMTGVVPIDLTNRLNTNRMDRIYTDDFVYYYGKQMRIYYPEGLWRQPSSKAIAFNKFPRCLAEMVYKRFGMVDETIRLSTKCVWSSRDPRVGWSGWDGETFYGTMLANLKIREMIAKKKATLEFTEIRQTRY